MAQSNGSAASDTRVLFGGTVPFDPSAWRHANRPAQDPQVAGTLRLPPASPVPQTFGIGGEGLLYRADVTLGDGEIDAIVSTEDTFVGIAFRILDDQTYDAVYLRPRALQSQDARERAQAIQYISHPTYSWQRLRLEAPGKYEADAGIGHLSAQRLRVRIRLQDRRIAVFIGDDTRPRLDVPQLSPTRGGGVGLWAGNGSGAALTHLAVRAAKRAPGAEVRRDLDVEYAQQDGEALHLDLYRPAQAKGRLPVVVWIHGGFWRANLRRLSPLLWLTDAGYAVASVDYRLISRGTFPAQLDDTLAALRYLRAHADQWGLDASRIFVAGDSSGAMLAALTALRDRDGNEPVRRSTAEASVRGILWYFGRSDLRQVPPGANEFVDGAIAAPRDANRSERLAAASVLAQISKGAPPFLLVHGDRDTVVPVEESLRLHEALRAANVDAVLDRHAKGGHWLEFYETSTAARGTLLRFLDRHSRR